MAHAVAPVFDQTLVQELILLGGQGVLELAIIADLDFFIPALVTDDTFALKRRRLAHVDCQVGERDSECRVGSALRNVGSCRDGPLAVGDLIGQVDSAAFGILGKGVGIVCVQAVARIARSGKIHTCREGQVRICLLILAVAPLHLEVLHLTVIRVTFLTHDGGQITDVERTGILIAFGIGRLRCQSPGSTGIDLTCQCQVGILTQGKVVTAIAQVKTAVIVLAESGHQDTTLVFLAEGEIAERHRNG